MVHQDEGFPAQRAAVGPLPAVCALVDPQAALLREPLPALSAAVRLLARVRPVVDAEVGRALEALPADRAPERTLPLVALLVQLELVQAAERLPAVGAGVAPSRAGERSVRVEAACWEGVVGLTRSISSCSLPLCVFIRRPQMCTMRRVPLGVNLFLLGALRSGLKTGRLRSILLILTVVDPIARPLRGQLLHAGRLCSV